MIKRLIMSLIILIGAVWLGLQIVEHPGYATFTYKNTVIQMRLWVAVVGILLVVFVLYYVMKILRAAGLMTKRFHFWAKMRKKNKNRKLINRGLIKLTEGYWSQAETLLITSATTSDNPVINYLAAARAAHEQSAYERRDDYLRQAHNATEDSDFAVSLTQAQLQLSHQQYEQALATLSHLRELIPSHRYVLKLLKRLYIELNEWQGLVNIIPDLIKYKVCKPQEITDLEITAYQALLKEAAKESTDEKLKKMWQKIPKRLHHQSELTVLYLTALRQKEISFDFVKFIQNSLKINWDDKLVELFGKIKANNTEKQLAIAETWLKQHSQNAVLLLALARIASHCHLWGKARSYYESAVAIQPSPIAYRELGQLLEQLKDYDAAYQSYKEGITLL